MENQDAGEILDLGIALGQNRAFGLLAGRCSAAQAESLRQLREEKKYLKCSTTWREFCSEYLKMNSGHADRIIRLWEEFGAGYFELAQLTRCSPETYRAIEPAVKEGTLRYQDETIELHPENARKVATAVAALRKKPARQLEMHERLHEIDRRCRVIAEEL